MTDRLSARKPSFFGKVGEILQFLARPWLQIGSLSNQLDSIGKKVDLLSTNSGLPVVNGQLDRLEASLRRLEATQTVYLGDHEALTRLYTGHRIYVDTRDISIASHLMLEGRWEPWVERALIPAIKPGMRFIDVGAHFGYYTLLGAEMVGAHGHVYSFEANPLIFQKLIKSVAVNGFEGRVSLFNVAVHDTSSPMEILFRHDASGGGWTDVATGARPAVHEVLPVQGEALDTLLADVPQVDVIKIDVEGAEPKVLAGAKNLIARSRNLTMILEFDTRRISKEPPQDYLQNFLTQGFSIAIVEPAGLVEKLSPAECLARLNGSVNYLMLTR
ncbi:MAG: FkbM family methyltransferase [Roseomonas sp.]|nr:FkbM family methyltransferase [Roseomonas sp.]MCA3283588.1 FkbM family methyltransferase [Roseomonas sp.]